MSSNFDRERPIDMSPFAEDFFAPPVFVEYTYADLVQFGDSNSEPCPRIEQLIDDANHYVAKDPQHEAYAQGLLQQRLDLMESAFIALQDPQLRRIRQEISRLEMIAECSKRAADAANANADAEDLTDETWTFQQVLDGVDDLWRKTAEARRGTKSFRRLAKRFKKHRHNRDHPLGCRDEGSDCQPCSDKLA